MHASNTACPRVNPRSYNRITGAHRASFTRTMTSSAPSYAAPRIVAAASCCATSRRATSLAYVAASTTRVARVAVDRRVVARATRGATRAAVVVDARDDVIKSRVEE